MLKDLVYKNRSYRRFYQDFVIEEAILKELVDLARLSASAANKQSLRFILACEDEKNEEVFRSLSWAGYLEDWPGPPEGEKPSAYIVILDDKDITMSLGCDYGIAAQSILLGAVEKGLGGCMVVSVKREQLRNSLSIPGKYDIHMVIALGKPKEEVVIEAVGSSGDIKYWRDDDGVHHVPKRSLKEIILE